MSAAVKYTIVRLVTFAVPLAILLICAVPWYWAAIVAAVAGLVISYVFFGKLRGQVAAGLASRSGRRNAGVVDNDTETEDAVLDAREDAAGADSADGPRAG